MASIRLSIQRVTDTDEWKIAYYIDGVLDEEKSYYTNDREDAAKTLIKMEYAVTMNSPAGYVLEPRNKSTQQFINPY